MKTRRLPPLLLFCLALTPLTIFASSGTFRGTVIDGPGGDTSGKVLFVKSRNGLVRKVDISSATIVYEGSVPQAMREKKPAAALKSGVDVRVTAEQGESGEWKATQVQIVGPDDEEKPVEREKPAPLREDTSVT